ncbi:uncharacterized protein RAG0_09678 [Rhynchosporium agropyri]|uniref:Uncharacterized protein n=1 Tax=Rhynchosporium agropyri TaxID=914238 RepID=A0A1E1KWN2_9HELO|nr:uncharacterized protein RAG0_09678 [Rhynchosporium agropyri]
MKRLSYLACEIVLQIANLPKTLRFSIACLPVHPRHFELGAVDASTPPSPQTVATSCTLVQHSPSTPLLPSKLDFELELELKPKPEITGHTRISEKVGHSAEQQGILTLLGKSPSGLRLDPDR